MEVAADLKTRQGLKQDIPDHRPENPKLVAADLKTRQGLKLSWSPPSTGPRAVAADLKTRQGLKLSCMR